MPNEKKYRLTNKETEEEFDSISYQERTVENTKYLDVKFQLSPSEIGDVAFEVKDGRLSNERYSIREIGA